MPRQTQAVPYFGQVLSSALLAGMRRSSAAAGSGTPACQGHCEAPVRNSSYIDSVCTDALHHHASEARLWRCRLVFHCLLELCRCQAKGIVEHAVLLGTPVGVTPQRWRMARTVVAGRLVNGYSNQDWVRRTHDPVTQRRFVCKAHAQPCAAQVFSSCLKGQTCACGTRTQLAVQAFASGVQQDSV